MEAVFVCTICLVSKAPGEWTKRQRLLNDADKRSGHCNACAFAIAGDPQDKSKVASLRAEQNWISVATHQLTYQQQDGRVHRKRRGETRRAAKQLTNVAKTQAALAMADFKSRFSLTGEKAILADFLARERTLMQIRADPACIFGPHTQEEAAYATLLRRFDLAMIRFNKLHVVHAHPEPWYTDEDSLTDFITTFPRDAQRTEFTVKQSKSPKHVHAPGTFTDSPRMTCHGLRFSSSLPAPRSVSHMPASRMLPFRANGTIIMQDGILVAGQAGRLISREGQELFLATFGVLDAINGEYLMRGDDVANVCGNFVILGYKCDRFSRQGLIHSLPSGKLDSVRHMNKWREIRSLFEKYVWPIAMEFFEPVLLPVIHWLQKFGLQLFVKCATAVTAGDCFWPQAHKDPDIWFTVLVCLHYGKCDVGGGDFAFTRAGWIFKCGNGSVLIYNPRLYHGTTEFDLPSKHDGKIFFAFYMKAEALQARLGSSFMPPAKLKLPYPFSLP